MSFWQTLKNWLRKLGSLSIARLPTISAASLAAATDDADYLYVFTEAYEQLASPEVPLAKLRSFTNEAAVLLLFGTLRGQVENGGFLQLIHNGYGPPIFDSPFTEDVAGWGAAPLAELTQQAAVLYRAHRAYLERPRSLAEFSALYQEFKEFEPLEDRFYDIIDSQAAIVRTYVAQHLARFARLT